MRKVLKLFGFLLVLLTTISVVSCGKPVLEGEEVKYSITLKATDGSRLKNVKVGFYINKYLMYEGVTGSNGVASIDAVAHNYTVKFANLPEKVAFDGKFNVEKGKTSYVFTLPTTVISSVKEGQDAYKIGDVVHNFTLTDTYGKKFDFKTEFEKYDLFLINFFYIHCGYCTLEMPVLQRALKGYEKRIGVIFISIDPSDTNEGINYLMEDVGVNFRAVKSGESNLEYHYNLYGTPSTAFIDKYGMFVEFVEGYSPSADTFVSRFITYLSPNY